MKFRIKSKKFIGAVVTALALAFGVPTYVAPVVTDVICERVACDGV